MNTVSSLSLNRLQSKTAKMTGLVLTDTFWLCQITNTEIPYFTPSNLSLQYHLAKDGGFPTK